MLYLVQTFSIPLIIALVGGLACGWVTSDKEDKGPSGWAALAITVFALMVVASALRWLPGRPGLWLDTAVLFSTVYLGGCVLGAFARVFTDKVEDLASEPMVEAAGAGQSFVSTPEPAAAPAASAPPLTGAAAAADAMARGTKPQGLAVAREGRPDDLKLVKGIGPQNEARLHALGIWHFDQIASWTEKEALWIGGYLAFPGRIEREEWIDQAKVLAEGGSTDFAERARRGEVPTSRDDDPERDDPNADLGHLNVSARPQGLVGPRAAGADDLTLIKGIGPEICERLHELGLWHFDQIAGLSDAELNYSASYAGAPGRAVRDNWAGEARILAAGGETEHSKAVRARRT
jgi:predicted flap endonuclease-1-like 5' DNA nuclease